MLEMAKYLKRNPTATEQEVLKKAVEISKMKVARDSQ